MSDLGPMDPADHLMVLRSDAQLLIDAFREGPDAEVPSCPGWTNRDLMVHMGRIHGWVAKQVGELAPERVSFPPRPDDGADVGEWAEQMVERLTAALGSASAYEPVWNWMDNAPAPAKFWHRRMAHETAVHRWDAQKAVGAEHPIDTRLAVDGVEELLEIVQMFTRGNEVGAGQTLHLHSTDEPGEWTIVFRADGVTVDHAHAQGDAAVRGPASDLMLFAWNRLGPNDGALESFGDAAVFDRWRTTATIS